MFKVNIMVMKYCNFLPIHVTISTDVPHKTETYNTAADFEENGEVMRIF